MENDRDQLLKKWIEQYVREVVEEQFDERDDAEAFLAIPQDSDGYGGGCDSGRWEAVNHGRWGDFSYSDYAFLYDVGISLDNPDGGSL